QGSRTMAIPAITVDGNTVRFEIQQVNAVYEGSLSPDGNSITGNAKMQNGDMRALNLVRASGDAAWAIPDPPKPMPADAKPKFDLLTVKPSDPNRPGTLVTVRGRHVMTINTTVSTLITFAYGIQQKQIVNGPAWMEEKYDIDGVPDVDGQPNGQQMRMLVADALVQRFGLKFHHEQKELPVYALTVAKGGPKLTVTADAPSTPGNFLYSAPGRLHVTNNTMKEFCKGMQESAMDKPVVDQTGLTDRYDFQLNWTPDQSQFGGRAKPPSPDDPNAPPSLYTALQEQLGLKLETTKAMVDAFAIDRMEKPGEN
ncbi:MAG TPA: TIGR03435 family protein, partial [Acidobacteriaceae bacterium]|nr:TIGR03435 family protein [Acidobacteriaceae bacterium]